MGNHLLELREHIDNCETCTTATADGDQAEGSSFAEILAHCCEEGARLRAHYYEGWEHAKTPTLPFLCSCRCKCSTPTKRKIGLETVPEWCAPCEELAEAGEMPHRLGYIPKTFTFPVQRGNGSPQIVPEDLIAASGDAQDMVNDLALHMATVIGAASLGDEFAGASIEGMNATVEGILEASIGTGKEGLCAQVIIAKLEKLGVPDEVIKKAQSFMDEGKEG